MNKTTQPSASPSAKQPNQLAAGRKQPIRKPGGKSARAPYPLASSNVAAQAETNRSRKALKLSLPRVNAKGKRLHETNPTKRPLADDPVQQSADARAKAELAQTLVPSTPTPTAVQASGHPCLVQPVRPSSEGKRGALEQAKIRDKAMSVHAQPPRYRVPGLAHKHEGTQQTVEAQTDYAQPSPKPGLEGQLDGKSKQGRASEGGSRVKPASTQRKKRKRSSRQIDGLKVSGTSEVAVRAKRRMPKTPETFWTWLYNSPTRLILMSFVAVILMGTVLLLLPLSTQPGQSTSLLTALFTATSATCVTGLVLVDTATHWSTFGQLVILTLIQIGGLGLVTLSTFFLALSRKKMKMRTLLAMQESTSASTFVDARHLVIKIIAITASFELLGTLIFFLRFRRYFPNGEALFRAVFHSVSAFCNAGFDLNGRLSGPFSSLIGFQEDPVVLLTAAGLLIVGGMGFIVWATLLTPKQESPNRFHIRVVRRMTLGLLVVGALLFFVLEHQNTTAPHAMGQLPWQQRPLAAFFQSATLRTGGFNAIDQGSLTATSKFISIIWMFIGAAPASTAGGIKLTTLAVLFAAIRSEVQGRAYPTLMGRRLKKNLVQKALVILCLGLVVVLTTSLIMSIAENQKLLAHQFTFLDIVFEATSAFGTVGLSSIGTNRLTVVSDLFLILTMFLGRVGPISFALSVGSHAQRHSKAAILPEGKTFLG